MIYLCDKQGVIKAVLPTPVNQGSVGVNEIVFIAPFPTTSTVSLAITLPNGVLVYPQPFPAATSNYPYNMTLAEDFIGVIDGGYNVWSMKLDKTLTQISGTARISFFVSGTDGTLSTPEIDFYINKTSPYLLNVTGNDLNTIGQYITEARLAAEEATQAKEEAIQTINNAEEAFNDVINNAEEAFNEKINKFNSEKYFDFVYDGNVSGNNPLPEDIQDFLKTSSGNVFIKNTNIVGLTAENISNIKNGQNIGLPENVKSNSDRFLLIPNTINTIVFSNCSFGDESTQEFGTCLIGDYKWLLNEGRYVLDNRTEIQLIQYSKETNIGVYGVAIYYFYEANNCEADVLSNCFLVHNCTVGGFIDSCTIVSDCHGKYKMNEGVGIGEEGFSETFGVSNCVYLDLHSMPCADVFYDGSTESVTVDTMGKVQILGGKDASIALEEQRGVRSLPQQIKHTLVGDILTLTLKGVMGEDISSEKIILPLSSVYRFKGSVQTYANLPSNASVGDVYNVESAYGSYPAGTNFAWNGEAWDALGGSITAEIVNGIIAQYLEDNPIYIPSITVTPIDNGHRVVITDKNGTNSFDVMNGITPIRGVNYWTPADIAEIKSYVDDAILGGEW